MPVPERPRLQRFLDLVEDPDDARFVLLLNRVPGGAAQVRLPLREARWLLLFDGRRTLRDVQAEAGGHHVPLERLGQLVQVLDEGLFLDSPRFAARTGGRVRAPSCIGCYEADPRALREQLEHLFAGPQGPGLPREPRPDGRLRAALLPHIDFARGGPTFAWGFKEVFERTDAALFVILGTAHYSPHRHTLTRKDFQTPLGVVPTDQTYIDRLVAHYGNGLFDDEAAHLPEHSIELEVVFLQYLYERRRPFRIVPLLVGPFQDCVETRTSPRRRPDIDRMLTALRRVEAEIREPICYLISGDLAHIGPKFGDPEPLTAPTLAHSRSQDEALLRAATAADAERYLQVIAAEGDGRRVCGLPPTYTTLAAVAPKKGRVLRYEQFVHPRGFESVSFASAVFDG